MADPNVVTIPLAEYLGYQDDRNWLAALEFVGVDNWEGYDTAVQLFNGEITEEDI